ncbi:MAG: hypothetical protein MUF43_13875, partial [Flavobacterium sp.]|nr:hypothetical protein [Flavobacterium sp.]
MNLIFVNKFFLQSGKVNKVSYQKLKSDQFLYKYSYDNNFSLNKVETSTDGIVWEQDALYYYYKHGPLARIDLGKNKVQGLDYAYTLQGWLKAINASTLNPEFDMGKDGLNIAAIPNGNTARDAIAFTLQYFQHANKDYEQIGRTNQKIYADLPSAMASNNLFNGNISSTLVSIMG